MRPAVLLLLLAGAAPAADPARRALLVGVTKYPNLAARFQLAGPANDVKLMRQTLADKFQFRPADIVTLSEADGTADPAKLPTRANIEREFQRLAATAAAGDTVFILMGGHGSQQPENHRPGAEPEPDGLDEVFLPRDVGAWDDKVGAVANAIIDDDLGAWLQAIRAKGASVCVVLDACHSGTMTRGGGGEQLRQLDAEADLGIPKAALDKARGAAADRPGEKTRGGGPAVEPPAFKLADKGGLVALYAAQASEPTAECDLPPKAARPERYGLLTFAVCSALTQAVENQSKPLTYRELAQRVHQQYAGWGRTFPTPVLEGGDRDREFLGDTVWPGRSQYTLAKTPAGGWAVNAGSVHGLTPNSLFDVLPPPGGGDQPVGQVRVTDVRPTGCDVEPLDPAAKLPAGGACKVARIDYGAMKLRVAVDPIDDADRPTPEPLRAKLLATVAKLGGDESLIEPVADPAKADWLVRALPDGRAVLAPAAGAVKGSATAGQGAGLRPGSGRRQARQVAGRRPRQHQQGGQPEGGGRAGGRRRGRPAGDAQADRGRQAGDVAQPRPGGIRQGQGGNPADQPRQGSGGRDPAVCGQRVQD